VRFRAPIGFMEAIDAAARQQHQTASDFMRQLLVREAAEIVRKADALMADHGAKLAELKQRRDRIDAEFSVTVREQREAAARQHRERVEAHQQGLRADIEAQLTDWQRLQAVTHEQRDLIDAMLARNARMSASAREFVAERQGADVPCRDRPGAQHFRADRGGHDDGRGPPAAARRHPMAERGAWPVSSGS
jgi:hypothetical protein